MAEYIFPSEFNTARLVNWFLFVFCLDNFVIIVVVLVVMMYCGDCVVAIMLTLFQL